MAASFHFYEDIFTNLNNSLSTYVSDVASNIIGAITPVATTLVTIYVALWGWSMIRGVIQEPVLDGLGRIVRLALITGIALNLGRYNGYLSDWLWNSPDALAAFIASGHSDSLANTQFLDQLMSQIYDLGDAYWQAAHANTTMGIPDIGTMAIAIIIWAVGIVATGYGAFLLALAKMSLAIILGVGPIFILLTIFEPTKKFFDAWIGQALSYVFLVMLTAAAIKLIMTIIQVYLVKTNSAGVLADPGIAQALPAIVLCIIGALVLMQLSSIASALGGGAAIGTLGAVSWAYGKAKGGVSSMRPTNMRRSLNKAKSDVRIAKDATKAVAGAPMAAYRKVTGANKNRVSKG